MFRSIGKKPFVVAACLLCGTFVGSTAHAGPITPIMPITPSEIEGDYDINLDQPQTHFPVTFTLKDGSVYSPTSLNGLTVTDIGVTESLNSSGTGIVVSLTNPGGPLGNSNFALSGTVMSQTGTITYGFIPNSEEVPSNNVVTSEITIASNTFSSTVINMANLNPALLTMTFPTNFDLGDLYIPSGSYTVGFTITPLPEPASIIHLAWVGALGAIGSWKRYRRAARCVHNLG